MDKKTSHRIVLSVVCLILFVLILLTVFHPIYALIWALLCGVLVMVLAQQRNTLVLAELEIWKERFSKLCAAWQARRKKKKKESDMFSSEFMPDHVLQGLNAPFDQAYLVNSDDFLIGSEDACSLVLRTGSASSVSRKHCRITYRRHSHSYYIEDLNSTNGTYVGTKRLEINSPERLLDNQEIVIGRYHFRFNVQEGGQHG